MSKYNNLGITLNQSGDYSDVRSPLHRLRYGRIEYLVKWEGFDDGANSWVPHYNLHSPDLVKHFHDRHPAALRHISATSFSSIPFRPRFPTPPKRSTNWRSAP